MLKKIVTFFLLITGIAQIIQAQPVYESDDFAGLNDSFFLSRINPLLIGQNNFDTTGANVTWDYSNLVPVSQRVSRFVSPIRTGFFAAFILSCNALCFNNCYANCLNGGGSQFICSGSCNFTCNTSCLTRWATRFDLAELASDSINLGIATINDVYNFYDKTQTALSQVAIGAKLSNFPIVLEFENPDRIYKFPLEFGSRDTSFSNYALRLDSVPGTGIPISLSYNHTQQRYNEIDGWGTLKTPFGEFQNVLRVKSEVFNQDSIIFQGDTIALNQFLPGQILPERVIEYKWFSADFGIPLLKVTAWVVGGNTIYNDLEFVDSLRCFDPFALFGYLPLPPIIGQTEDSVEVNFFSLSVNADSFTWDFGDPTSASNTGTGANPSHHFTTGGIFNVKLTSCNTACAVTVCNSITIPVFVINLSTTSTPSIMKHETGLRVFPSPFQDEITVFIRSQSNMKMNINLYDLSGKVLIESPGTPVNIGENTFKYQLRHLLPGIYVVSLTTDESRQFFKIIKTN